MPSAFAVGAAAQRLPWYTVCFLPALVHADLYRLAAGEARDLGLEEYAIPTSVLLVEWADRDLEYLEELPHTSRVHVDLTYGEGDDRELTVTGDNAVATDGGAC